MSSTLESSVFMEKDFSDNWHSIKTTKDLTLKQSSTHPRNWCPNEMRSMEWKQLIVWENSSWKHLSLIGDEQVISLQRTKVYVFSDSVLCLGKRHETPQLNTAWEQDWSGSKTSQECRNFDWIDSEPMEFEWNIFQGFSSVKKSKVYCWDWMRH